MSETFTALVPMKHESERVPGKNLRFMCGRPLYHWVLDALSESDFVERIVVNTDSDEVAEGARQWPRVTILKRPDHLLGHGVGITPLIKHDLAHTEGEYYLLTHCTNPLLTTTTIDRALETFLASTEHDSLFSVTPLQARLFWPDGSPVNHDPDNLLRTQDLAPIYQDNSCMYVFSRTSFYRRENRIGENPIMFSMDPEESVDIDEPIDFTVAETLLKVWLEARSSAAGRSQK